LLGTSAHFIDNYRAVEVYLIEVYPIELYLKGKGAVAVSGIFYVYRCNLAASIACTVWY
jgi:hypothetical protein